MRKSFKLAFAFSLLATAAHADTLPRPTASYDATVTSTIGSNFSTAEINAAGPRTRLTINLPNGPLTLLIDRGLNQAFIIVPALGTSMPVTQKMMDGYDLNALNTLPVTAEGPDKVNGVDATRYAVDAQIKPGSSFAGYVWATQDGALLKIDGTATMNANTSPVKIELSNFQRRAQNPALFIPQPQLPLLLNTKRR